jgi:hypothetical protein
MQIFKERPHSLDMLPLISFVGPATVGGAAVCGVMPLHEN